ncbi:MAG: hypothetical protein JXN65_11410 [Clostridia bacterium]|nr:hypothetical protein [Clostridia bacterium]
MWTKKAHFIFIYIKIDAFRLPIFIPAFILNTLITEICDLVNFFTFYSAKITAAMNIAEAAVQSITDFGKLDLVDIDVVSGKHNKKVKIKIFTR